MNVIPKLLGGTGIYDGDGDKNLPALERGNTHYVTELTRQATIARTDFNSHPCASTAIRYAQSYGYYLDNSIEGGNSINTYPLMFFINSDRSTYMVYSDITKSWFTVGYDDEDRMMHQLDTLGGFGSGGTFEFISDGSSFIFDATFKRPLIVDIPNVAPLYISTNTTYTAQTSISNFH